MVGPRDGLVDDFASLDGWIHVANTSIRKERVQLLFLFIVVAPLNHPALVILCIDRLPLILHLNQPLFPLLVIFILNQGH